LFQVIYKAICGCSKKVVAISFFDVAQRAATAGVDIILGHHAHAPYGMETFTAMDQVLNHVGEAIVASSY
jgi:hypothetical protein